MKRNHISKAILASTSLSLMCFLGGCSTTDMKEMVSNGNVMSTGVKLPPSNPGTVKIYDTVPKSYKVVGRISADNYNVVGMKYSQDSIFNELKKLAASVGANGVANVNQGLTQTTAQAIVVKK